EVDGSSFKVDQYIVTVESIDAGQTATTIFNVVEGQPTTQPTGNVTTTPTGTETTPTTTTTTQATPTTTPGFGALLALAGLGAVAFLVLRRD
ncbi:PGF-CTERM sorting domain-containing protein, partial [Methanoculleus sp.]